MSSLAPFPTAFRVSENVAAFESHARLVGIKLEATQLAAGDARIGFGVRMLGDAALASYRTTRTLGMAWEARSSAISFSVRVGPVGLKIEGRDRNPYSVVMYVEPGVAMWSGLIEGTDRLSDGGAPSYHVSVPMSAVQVLNLPVESIRRGWLEVPLDSATATRFSGWADRMLQGASVDRHVAQDELYWWLSELLRPALAEPTLETPSHYTRIIGMVLALADDHLTDPIAVTEISQNLRVSVRTIQRAFQTVYGMGVSRFLRHRRLRKAQELLRAGDITVYRAAYETGFHHVPRFSQQYRRLFGHSPSETL